MPIRAEIPFGQLVNPFGTPLTKTTTTDRSTTLANNLVSRIRQAILDQINRQYPKTNTVLQLRIR